MLKINAFIKLGDNREYIVQDELLLYGKIYYVLATSEDNYCEKIFTECVEYEGEKYIRVVESEDIWVALEEMLRNK